MNEHVFCLKTGIDDFKHESCRDAFGTLSHDVMIRSLEEIQLPQLFIDIVKDVYRDQLYNDISYPSTELCR